MPGRCMSPLPLLVFVSCVLFVLVLFLFMTFFWARTRVSSLCVVESNLSSPFILFPTLCGHATSSIVLSCSMPPSCCCVLCGRGPVFNVAMWESMAEQTHCARVRKRPRSVRNASTTSVRKAFVPSHHPWNFRICRFGTVVAASRVTGAFSHGARGRAGPGSAAAAAAAAAAWCVRRPRVPTVTGLLHLGVAILVTLSAFGESRPGCA